MAPALLLFVVAMAAAALAQAQIGVNWGTQLSHPLPPDRVVQMLAANRVSRVKLFDPDERVMKALAGSNLEVMVGIPNEMLAALASNADAADRWVRSNLTAFVSGRKRVNVKYVAVGNEPFLTSFNGSYEAVTLPALQNIAASLSRAGLSDQIKVTVPINADILTSTPYPSATVFRDDIRALMVSIVHFLNQTGGPFTMNLYPFLSLRADPNFPRGYAFFDDNSSPVVDGSLTYTNVFDASYDSLIAALSTAGYPSMTLIVGEVGWPTDGELEANVRNAQQFNQGLLRHVLGNAGTPLRPGVPLLVYLFSLVDEDMKSVLPGNFERHWGIFTYDGQAKYALDMSGRGDSTARLQNVQGVGYQDQRWCILNSSKPVPPASVAYACSRADCTALSYGGSCNTLDAAGNASYAFNAYYQITDQLASSCDFQGYGVVTTADPSTSTCRFIRQIVPLTGSNASSAALSSVPTSWVLLLLVVLGRLLVLL